MSYATSDHTNFLLFRASAISLAALAIFDNFALGGQYLDHVEALARSLSLSIIG
jgi:hypothetical protein